MSSGAMDTWDIASLDVEPHQPAVLRSDDETRVIAINLPAGEDLQEHQVHERAWLVVARRGRGRAGRPDRAGGPASGHFEPDERHEVRAPATLG